MNRLRFPSCLSNMYIIYICIKNKYKMTTDDVSIIKLSIIINKHIFRT